MKKLIALLLAMLCVFALAGCGSTEWTLSESQLSARDAAAVDRCLRARDWQDGLTDCAGVRLTDGSGRRVDYCAGCGGEHFVGAGVLDGPHGLRWYFR